MGIRDQSGLVIFSGDRPIADQVIFCASRHSRRKGLLGRSQLTVNEGILMELPDYRKGKAGVVNSIHLLGMRFSIAAAWLNLDGRIVHSVLARKWHPYYGTSHPSWYILELHPSRLSLLPTGAWIRWEIELPNDDRTTTLGQDVFGGANETFP
jgi:uncharacterized membrane protein (UPF0127 family)